MTKINTVLGQIASEELGLTLAHEHIVAAYPGWECDPLAKPYNLEKIAGACLKNLEPVKQFGVKAIIDGTPVDLSRNVDVMKDVSEKLQIHIVCATGRYTEAEGKWIYFKRRESVKIGDMQTEIYEGIMQEINHGIGQTGIKPGVIKVGTGLNRITSCENATLMAAARASRETGIPITTHTEDGTMGPEQADILISEGAAPDKIMIGHMCGNASVDYHLDVLKRGVFIALDRFGIEMKMTDQTRVATLISLLKKGYANRIMISHDCMAAVYGRGGRMPMEEAIKFKNWSFTNIFTNILPALKKAGISDEQIKTMMVDNPRRFLSGD
ncbi:MAG TPA: phosphotriesterase-related protein [Deltaproteobacteria bacterium]|nr:phosphotriesterase-related protein [Deltaproteobacteria bacterium]